MKNNLSKSGRKQFRESHITQHMKAGLSQVEYCRLHKISIKSFQYWKRKSARGSLAALVEVALPKSLPNPLSTPCLPLCLVIGNQYRIEIGRGFDAEDLERVVRILERI
jgi:hypothetical protein